MPSLAFYLPWPLIIIALAWLFTKRNTNWGRQVIFGLGFFLINLVPILGFVTMSYMRITWVADHLIYLPLLGLIGIVAAGIATLYDYLDPDRRAVMVLICSVLLAVTLVDSNAYATIFFNEDLMWTYNLKYNDNAWQAHSRLAKVKMEQGKFQEAIYHITRSHDLRPDLAETNNNLASALEHQGKVDEALTYLRRAHQIEPKIAIFQLNLASLLYKHGDYGEAEENFSELLRKDSNNPVYLCNDGVCLYFLGRYDEAIAAFRKALSINPNLKDAQENLNAAMKKKNGEIPTGTPGARQESGTSNYNFQLFSRPPGI
jgi:tetratricopeptide (TPR) repeat protein